MKKSTTTLWFRKWEHYRRFADVITLLPLDLLRELAKARGGALTEASSI
jgi:hypothetical protein